MFSLLFLIFFTNLFSFTYSLIFHWETIRYAWFRQPLQNSTDKTKHLLHHTAMVPLWYHWAVHFRYVLTFTLDFVKDANKAFTYVFKLNGYLSLTKWCDSWKFLWSSLFQARRMPVLVGDSVSRSDTYANSKAHFPIVLVVMTRNVNCLPWNIQSSLYFRNWSHSPLAPFHQEAF